MGAFYTLGSLSLLLVSIGTSWALTPEMKEAVEKVVQRSGNTEVLNPISNRLKTLMQEEAQAAIDLGFSKAGSGSAVAANSTQPTQFVVGGTVIPITRRPWQCLVEIDLNNTKNSFENRPNWFFICGCTVYGRRWVLTAAHCILGLFDFFNYRVRSGVSDLSENGGQVLRVIAAKTHPDVSLFCRRNETCAPNDIGVLKLSRKIRFDKKTMPIRFATPRLLQFPEKTECFLSGFGSNGTQVTGQLMEVRFPIHPNDICNCNLLLVGQNAIFDGHVCSFDPEEKVSGCFGDSGGPYVCRRKGRRQFLLVGLVSFGFFGCTPTLPTVYSNVPFHCDWIRRTTGAPRRCGRKIYY